MVRALQTGDSAPARCRPRQLQRRLDRFAAAAGEEGGVVVAAALAQAITHDAITDTGRRWSLKVSLPRHPVSASACYTPITTGDELRRVALRYRNCVRSYLPNILEERSAFALFRQGDDEAIVHLVRTGDGWRFDRALAPATDVSTSTSDAQRRPTFRIGSA